MREGRVKSSALLNFTLVVWMSAPRSKLPKLVYPGSLKWDYAACSFTEHISGIFPLTSTSVNGGGTALPQRANCLPFAYFSPR